MAALKKVEFTIGVRDRTRRVFRRVTRGLRELASSAAALGVRIATVATAGFGLLARSALTTARSLKDVAGQLNLSTDFLQAFQNAVREGGASVESSSTFLQRFTTNLGKAREGQISFVQAFERAGIRGQDLLKDPLVVLDQLLANIKDLDQAGRQAVVSPIGDVEGVKAINALLSQSLDTVEKISEFGGRFGIIPGTTLDRLDDASTKFALAFQNIKPALFEKVAEVLEKLTPLLPAFVSALVGFTNAVERAFGAAARNISALRTGLGGQEVQPGGRGRFDAVIAANREANKDLIVAFDFEGNRRIMTKIERNTRGGATYGP